MRASTLRFYLPTASMLLLLMCPAITVGQPLPGDIYAEYIWRGPHINAEGWQRVTDPEAGDSRAHAFLPNPVNRITLPNLAGAIAAEVVIEQWGGHTGTTGKAMRINGGDWLSIAHPAAIPGDSGREGIDSPECYQYFTYSTISVPLEDLVEGRNSFEFTSQDQNCFGFGWGQWGVYGVIFRLYYDSDTPHPTGRIIAPQAGSLLGASPLLEAEASSPNGAIASVDFIGHYEDYDYDGDGIWREWHYIYQFGRLKRHLGSATEAPFRAVWDTEWVPDQDAPMAVMARIRDASGIYYMTEPVGDLGLDRRQGSVGMYKPYNVPPQWISRAGRAKSAEVFVPSTLAATQARAVITTWSGAHADAITFNGETLVPTLVPQVGSAHDYGHDVIDLPLDLVRPGSNRFTTFSSTLHHGIEVMWPGITLFVRYDQPQQTASSAAVDLHIFADELDAGWTAVTPEDGAADSEKRPDAFAGEQVLRILPSDSFNAILDLTAGQPQSIAGYKALRFAIHPHQLQIKSFHRLNLVIWGQALPLLKNGVSLQGLDFSRKEWQTIEVPLADFQFRFPYLETLHFEGRLEGDFLMDDVRLVADEVRTVVESGDVVQPETFRLYPNRPNPFNASTIISFHLPHSGRVALNVFNLAGQKVAGLIDDALAVGHHKYSWDGRGKDGRVLASGVYLCRLEGLGEVRTLKLLLLQ